MQLGITYVAVLVVVGLLGLALGHAATLWGTAGQREKERELLFVGAQFRDAIGRYYEATPGVVKQYPQSLDDLLLDRRFPNVRRHLRKIFVDPMTGTRDWGLVRGPGNGITGIHSRSTVEPFKRSNFDPADKAFEEKKAIAEWRFVYAPGGVAVPAAPGSAPAAPGVPGPGPGSGSPFQPLPGTAPAR
jgi:type II secretory pathway pseudopilin PulG